MGRNLRILTILLALAAAVAPASAWADGMVFVVNSPGDLPDAVPGDGSCATTSGFCTLRAAIQEANAQTGLDTIKFGIGSGPRVILVSSALPAITDPVVIDGTTQPGFAGTPIVDVNGALVASTIDGLVITGGGSTVRGLVVNGFKGNGITLSGAGGNVLEGDYVGINVAGTAAVANGNSGVLINGSPNNRIGGTTAAARNVISGNLGPGDGGGILILGSTASGNVVEGNYVGTDITGAAPLGNGGRGVSIKDAPNNVIGGPAAGAGNLISANAAIGVRILGASATGNVLQGNLIGTDAQGQVHWGVLNNVEGVQIRSDNNTVIANLIAGNSLDGVAFLEDPNGNLVQGNIIAINGLNGIGHYQTGLGNRLTGNYIDLNGALGIDLAPTGPTPNDPGDADTGPNNLQNYPTVIAAAPSGSATIVSGSLDDEPDGTYTVELFASPQCDASGFGEGRLPIGSFPVALAGGGTAFFAVRLDATVASGWVVTATATDAGGNTSEFSACTSVP